MAKKKKNGQDSPVIEAESKQAVVADITADVQEGENEHMYYDEVLGKWKKKYKKNGKLSEGYYLHELMHLQEELVKLQYWIREKGLPLLGRAGTGNNI